MVGHSLGNEAHENLSKFKYLWFLGAHIAGNVGRYFNGELSRYLWFDSEVFQNIKVN